MHHLFILKDNLFNVALDMLSLNVLRLLHDIRRIQWWHFDKLEANLRNLISIAMLKNNIEGQQILVE